MGSVSKLLPLYSVCIRRSAKPLVVSQAASGVTETPGASSVRVNKKVVLGRVAVPIVSVSEISSHGEQLEVVVSFSAQSTLEVFRMNESANGLAPVPLTLKPYASSSRSPLVMV